MRTSSTGRVVIPETLCVSEEHLSKCDFRIKLSSAEGPDPVPDLVEQALVQAGLWQEVKDRLEAPAQALSQGQQQRLSLARTLALDPDVLLLDEPTASLDQKSAAVIEEMALSLKSSRTLVWVTHDPLQAQRISDTQIILDQGKVLPEDHRIRKIS